MGSLVEGPCLEAGFESFVGLWPIPMRHGLSLGELARLLAAEDALDLELDVVPCAGWERGQRWQELGRPWVPTSPNLPRNEGVELYPGMVLFEGTQLSEGRGTTTPFEGVGAPGLDPRAWLAALMNFTDALEGVALRPIRFEPTFQKHARQSCGGLFVHATDRERIRPYSLALALIGTARQVLGDDFAWLPPPYEYEHELMPFDILTGSSAARAAIDAGLTPETLAPLTGVDLPAWRERSGPHLLYPGGLGGGRE